MIEHDELTIIRPGDAGARRMRAHEAVPVRSVRSVPLLGALLVLVAFGSLAAASTGQRIAAVALGAGAAVAGLTFLLSPLRRRRGGGYAVSGLTIGIAGCLLIPLFAVAGIEPTAVVADSGPIPSSTVPSPDGTGSAPAETTPAETTPAETTPAETAPLQLVRVTPDRVAASATAQDSVDGAGDPVSFAAEQLIDDDPTTAWRVPGDGVGQSIVFTLPGRTHLHQIAVIPGYAKRDPVTGEDRFSQNRRVRRLAVTLDDRSGSLDLDPDSPALQKFEVDSVTSTVTIQIESTTAPAPRDFAAMSEVQFWAQA
jgi:hypothetical protein